ncbi:MAG TPA: peptide deformylase [Thermodesulfobacteriota bacterium]|nr:peptide deformylase [Thermodesulfobacteriota bacterium]
MAVLDICKYPDPVLLKKAKPVIKLDDTIKKLIGDMIDTMYQAPGIGLAANQIGRPIRIIVFDITPKDQERQPSVLVNPEIIESEGEQTLEEGCLSVPEYYSDVKRSAKVKVRGQDLEGNPVEVCGEGLLATVLQHEIDHLDGILFIDRISALKRSLYKKRIQKKLKKQEE